MSTTPTLGLALPAQGSSDWNTPLNDNFTIIDTAFAGLAAGLQSATTTLTAAQLKDLASTPVILIAAPGAGKLIVPISAVWQLLAGATLYNSASSHVGTVWEGGAVDTGVLATLSPPAGTAFWQSAVNKVFVSASDADFMDTTPLDQTAIANKAYVMTNFGTDLTLGDGTLAVTVHYTIVDLS